jgi:hypothetical protein
MKMLIFVVVFVLVAAVILWRVRKADAERLLAQQKELHRKERERKKAVSASRHVEWPVIIRPAGKHPPEEEEEVPEPSMTSIEFQPTDPLDLRH